MRRRSGLVGRAFRCGDALRCALGEFFGVGAFNLLITSLKNFFFRSEMLVALTNALNRCEKEIYFSHNGFTHRQTHLSYSL